MYVKKMAIELTHKKIGIILIIILTLSYLSYFYYLNYYLGDYIIQEQWINSSYEGKYYCNDCLWIRFYEGCNRYPVYFFENQHEFDNRLNRGDIVNINFKNGYIKKITLAKKYREKC